MSVITVYMPTESRNSISLWIVLYRERERELLFFDWFAGTPRPAMRWTKNGQLLQAGGSVDLEQSADVCVFRVTNARRSDSADYELELKNDSGTETVPITVKVIGSYSYRSRAIRLRSTILATVSTNLATVSIAVLSNWWCPVAQASAEG